MTKKGNGSEPSILVIVAALNEEDGIGPTITEIKQHLREPRILVVDGKSCDRTVEISKAMGVEVIYQEGQGKGDAIATAINYTNCEANYLGFIDADYSYPAQYLPQMIDVLERDSQVGMVCGNRFNACLDVRTLRRLLHLGNRFLAIAHNFFNEIDMCDPLTGLRVVRMEVLKDWRPKSRGFDVEVEMNYYVGHKGYRIAELPILYRHRLGEKKLKIKHGATIFRRILLNTMY